MRPSPYPKRSRRAPAWLLAAAFLAIGLPGRVNAAAGATAQRGGGGGGSIWGMDAVEPNPAYDGRFTFARLRYGDSELGIWCRMSEGSGWHHDYPVAERNLMNIMGDVVDGFDPRRDSSVVFDADDPELTRYPVVYLSEPGCWKPTASEVIALRNYLLKGGFLIVDDFRGLDWENFEAQMRRVLPQSRFVPVNRSDPIFDGFFGLQELHVKSRGGSPEFQGIYQNNDPRKRLIVIANYNLDIGDYWQWSPDGLLPVSASNQAYKFGVNYIIYGLTH